jgi:TolB-like protein
LRPFHSFLAVEEANMRTVIVLVAFLVAASAAFAQPQLAVLRTSSSSGIDPTVAEPITEKIIESIVKSGAYTVLDRLNIDKILTEKEFQMTSAVVSQAEMRRAGEYLGADFVLLASISRVGTTFILSAKMVDVISGAITVQVSEERKGSIDVLLEAASVVGERVSGAARIGPGAAVAKAAPKKVEAPAPAEAAAATDSIFGIRSMLDQRVFMKEAGAKEVAAMAAKLGLDERTRLYKSYKKGFALGYSMLNIIPSLGSWLQGDTSGALYDYVFLASGALLGGGIYTLTTNPGNRDIFLLLAAAYGGIILGEGYGLIRPFVYAGSYNRMLSRSLLIVDSGPRDGARVATSSGLGLTLLRIEL